MTTTNSGSTPDYPRTIKSIPYSESASHLQTLDIWFPRPVEQSDPDKTVWIIYIHGGAWRDPTQTSTCALPTLTHLESHTTTLPHIAGLASLNYRLSPYPSHPTDPSSPSDAERNVQHPTHVRDVIRGIEFVVKKYGIKRWIGVGHSCGATLLMQYVSGIGRDTEASGSGSISPGPESLLLSAGIYNIPLFLRTHTPPTVSPEISQIYQDIIAGAFSSDASTYHSVSPVSGSYNTSTWAQGKLIILAHSYDDELVERAQRDVMCVALDREGWDIVMEDGDEEADVAPGKRVLEVRDVKGSHDFFWEDGEQSARLIAEVVGRLVGIEM